MEVYKFGVPWLCSVKIDVYFGFTSLKSSWIEICYEENRKLSKNIQLKDKKKIHFPHSLICRNHNKSFASMSLSLLRLDLRCFVFCVTTIAPFFLVRRPFDHVDHVVHMIIINNNPIVMRHLNERMANTANSEYNLNSNKANNTIHFSASPLIGAWAHMRILVLFCIRK